MITKELTTVLLEILEEDYLISHDRLKEEYWDMALTGKHFRLSGFELATLILEFEKRTGIMIDINEKPMYALACINEIIKSISQGEFATNN